MYEMDELNNGDSLFIWLAFMNCQTNYIDRDCFSEHVMNCPGGGSVAYIGNTRDGWYLPGDSENSPSNLYDKTFFRHLYGNKGTSAEFFNIGQTLAMSKMEWISEANMRGELDSSDAATGGGPTMRWCMFQLSLLGDPEMPIWTDQAQYLAASHPSHITLDDTLFWVKIANGAPGDTAVICVQKGAEAYAAVSAAIPCSVSFVCRANTPGPIAVTVGSHNYIPYQGTCNVGFAPSAHLYVSTYRLDDGLPGGEGNGDGIVNPGECAALFATVKNSGKAAAFNGIVRAIGLDSLGLISFSDDTAAFYRIDPGDSAICRFMLGLGAGLPYNIDYYPFKIIFDICDNRWKDEITLTARADSLAHSGHKASGLNIYPEIANLGGGSAAGIEAFLNAVTPGVLITDGYSQFGEIKACSTKLNLDDGFSWKYEDPYAPTNHAVFRIAMRDAYEREWSHDFYLTAEMTPPDSVWNVTRPDRFDLFWAYNARSAPAGLAGFNVYRSRDMSGPYERVNPALVKGVNLYADNLADPHELYYHCVCAVDSSGNESGYSESKMPKYPLLRGWPQFSGRPLSYVRNCNSSPAVHDINGDGVNDVVVSSFEGTRPEELGPLPNGKIYAWNADGILLSGFPADIGYAVETSVCLGDVNRDGRMEILHGDGGLGSDPPSSRRLYAWDYCGSPALHWPVNLSAQLYGPPIAADLDGDGVNEIIAACMQGRVYVLDSLGTPLAGWPKDIIGDPYLHSPSVGNLDSESDLEIVVAIRGNAIYAWKSNGETVAGWPVTYPGTIVASPVLGDIDHDGRLEIITFANVAGGGKVIAWNPDGTLRWEHFISSNIRVEAMTSPSLGDVNGDGYLDVVISTNDGRTHCISYDGSPLWSIKLSDLRIHSSALIGDINGDGQMEVIVNATNMIYALNKDGKILPGFPLETPPPVSNVAQPTPTLADLDKNGTTDIVYRGYDHVYAWNLLGLYDRNKIE